MKKLITCFAIIFLLFLHIPSIAQWQWAVSSNSQATFDPVQSITDKNGDIYVSGFFTGTGSILFGPNTSNGSGHGDIVIAKADSNGNWQWGRIIRNVQPTNMLCADDSGNVYVGVVSSDTSIIIGPFLISNPSAKTSQILVKFSITGSWLWAVNMGQVLFQASVGGDENIYLAGTYKGKTLAMGSSLLHNTDTSGNSSDLFIAKLNPSGTAIWGRGFGSHGNDRCDAMTVTKNGILYFLGQIPLGDSFMLGTNFLVDSTLFLLKFDSIGMPMHSGMFSMYTSTLAGLLSTFNPTLLFFPSTMALDRQENIYVCGKNFHTVFSMSKFDSACNKLWDVAVNGSANGSAGFSISVDTCGILWASGAMFAFGSTLPAQSYYMAFPADTLFALANSKDPSFIAAYTTSGQYMHSYAFSSGGDDANFVNVDNKGNLFFCGDYYDSSIAFGNIVLPPDPNAEYLFVAKYNYSYLTSCFPPINHEEHAATIPMQAGSLMFYPNPVSSTLNIIAAETIKDIGIYNLAGQMLHSSAFVSNIAQLNVATLPPGLYFVKVNGIYAGKFVKE